MSVDFRTRVDHDAQVVDIDEFFAYIFPSLLTSSDPYLQAWLATTTPCDISIECESSQWQLSAADQRIQINHGTSASGLKVRLSADDFSGLVNDLYTPMTFFTSGTLNIERGQLGDFLDWWLVLRAVTDQRPIHTPGKTRPKDKDGALLELNRSFSLDDPLPDMQYFLETAGFLHLANVFTEEEMAAISSDMDSCHDSYTEGDGKSWWATTDNGARRLVRMQSFDQRSAATARLLQDPRLSRIGEITGDGHQHSGLEGNAIEALIKPLNVVKGISDLPWHKDCSLGRHSYECCSLTVGVSVTGADAESGQLRVIAGSHKALMWPSLLTNAEDSGLPVVELPTKTGDVTIHLSCTHHMAQAPTARERRVLYTSFRLPSVAIDSTNPARARINQARELAYQTVSQ